jgi:outer membrane receptor protein involved in Fe transport
MAIGKRYAKAFPYIEPVDESEPAPEQPTNKFYVLKDVISFNLGVEYRYTKSLSFFLKLNNLSGAKYERWNFYPSKRFNMMGGFTYSL